MSFRDLTRRMFFTKPHIWVPRGPRLYVASGLNASPQPLVVPAADAIEHRLKGGGGVLKGGFGGTITGRRGRETDTWGDYGVSLDDLGLSMEEIAKSKMHEAFAARGKKPKEVEPKLSQKLRLKLKQEIDRNAPTPPLEVPQDRFNRSNLCQRYYISDGVAGPGIRSEYEFVIGPGFDVVPDYHHEEVPGWFNINAPEVSIAKGKFPGKNSKARSMEIFREYLRLRAEELKERLELELFANEIARDALVLGDGFGFRVDSTPDESFLSGPGSKELLDNTPWQVQGINPLAVNLETDDFGEVTAAFVKKIGDFGDPGTRLGQEELQRLIHVKWNSNRYTTYGTPQMVNALEDLILKESFMRAAKASADRFATPIVLARFGVMAPGNDGGPIAGPDFRDEMLEALRAFNPTRDILVGPFHWTIDYIGTEGDVLNLAAEIAECNRRIMMALGIPPNFLDSNYTSYSTAKIQVANMFLKLRMLQMHVARAIEQKVLQPWAKMRNYVDDNGQVIKFKVIWRKANLEGDPEMLSTIRTMAMSQTQEVVSKRTMRTLMGLNADIEEQNLKAEEDAKRARREELGLDPNTGLPFGQKVDDFGNPVNDDEDPNAPNAPKDQNGRNTTQNDGSQVPGAKPKKQSNETEQQLRNVEMVVAELMAKQGEFEEHIQRKMDEGWEEMRRITRARRKVKGES